MSDAATSRISSWLQRGRKHVPAMSHRGKRWLLVVCYVSMAGAILAAISWSTNARSQLTREDAILFVAMGLVSLPLLFLRGLATALVFQLPRRRRTLNDLFAISVWNTSANLLPLSPGLAAKGVLLHRMFAIGAREYVVATLSLFLIAISTSGLTGLAGLIWLRSPSVWLWLGFTGMLLCIAPVWWDMREWLKRVPVTRRFASHFPSREDQWRELVVVHVVIVTLECLRLSWAFSIVGATPSFPSVLVVSSGTILMRFANITPGGIGVREALIVAFSATAGIPLNVSLMAAGIDRLAALSGLSLSLLLVGATHRRNATGAANDSIPSTVTSVSM